MDCLLIPLVVRGDHSLQNFAPRLGRQRFGRWLTGWFGMMKQVRTRASNAEAVSAHIPPPADRTKHPNRGTINSADLSSVAFRITLMADGGRLPVVGLTIWAFPHRLRAFGLTRIGRKFSSNSGSGAASLSAVDRPTGCGWQDRVCSGRGCKSWSWKRPYARGAPALYECRSHFLVGALGVKSPLA
jgi:hypothetical protein